MKATEAASETALAHLLARGGFVLDDTRAHKLWRFHQLLRDANPTLRLTRIDAFEAMAEKHYLDSLLPATFAPLPSPLIDLGSGGGLPGIPLAIAYPDVQFMLAEARRRRAGFLMRVVQTLKLNNVEVVARKLGPQTNLQTQGCITRAFGSIADTLQLAVNLVAHGGQIWLLKGPHCDDEIQAARTLPFDLTAQFCYELPFSNATRRLLIYIPQGV